VKQQFSKMQTFPSDAGVITDCAVSPINAIKMPFTLLLNNVNRTLNSQCFTVVIDTLH